MCIGIPMQVVSGSEAAALCEGRGRRQNLNMLMVGSQPPGTWVLAFLGVAREVLTEQDAARINRALDALEAALQGATDMDAYFPDLAEREPELPEHLKRASS